MFIYISIFIYIYWDAERFMITSNHVHKCGYFILLPILRPTQMLLLPILRTNILPHFEHEHLQYLRQAASLLPQSHHTLYTKSTSLESASCAPITNKNHGTHHLSTYHPASIIGSAAKNILKQPASGCYSTRVDIRHCIPLQLLKAPLATCRFLP